MSRGGEVKRTCRLYGSPDGVYLRTSMKTLPFLATAASRGARLASLSLIAVALVGCDDDTRFPAQFDNQFYNIAVGAMNGTPLNEPAALSTYDTFIVRLDGSYNFDVAFDIDGAGRPVIVPQPLVGTASGSSRPVGLQRLGTDFAAVTIAPRARSGWVYDSTFTVALGEVIAVQSRPTPCAFDFDPYLYSKLRVDSVKTTTRKLYVTVVTNPNCGYRSFLPGRPTD